SLHDALPILGRILEVANGDVLLVEYLPEIDLALDLRWIIIWENPNLEGWWRVLVVRNEKQLVDWIEAYAGWLDRRKLHLAMNNGRIIKRNLPHIVGASEAFLVILIGLRIDNHEPVLADLYAARRIPRWGIPHTGFECTDGLRHKGVGQ